MTELDKFKLQSNGRFVVTRWLLLFLGIFIVGLSMLVDLNGAFGNLLPTGLLMIFFVGGIVFNIPLYFLVTNVQSNPSRLKTVLVSALQVISDLLGITFLIFLLGGPGNITAIFYFLPIIEAVVLFDFIFPIFIAILSGAVLNGFVYLGTAGILIYPAFISNANDWTGGTFDLFVISASYATVYLILAAIFSYNYQFVRPIKIFQLQTKPEKIDPKVTEKMVWAKAMDEKLESKNRELYAKDLELKIAKGQLDKLEQAKSKFISVTTHQLRTPLSAIKWTFNMILGGQLGTINDEQKQFMQKGYDSTQKMISIVNNLLNLDHINGEGEEFSMVKIQLEELIKNVVFEFENQLASKNIKLVIKQPEKPLPLIEADPNQIRIVIENLLDNAIKYTPKNGEVTIQIRDDRINMAQRSAEIVVRDTGMGIPEEDQKKIFHKFFRATNAISHEPDGSGIGLFISKEIVERHNGTMWFESVESKGAAFHFTLLVEQPKELKKSEIIPAKDESTTIVSPVTFETEKVLPT